MPAGAGLSIGPRQRLALTPSLQESVRLLQHSPADLRRLVEERLASNPLLDRDAPEPPPGGDAGPAALDSWSDTHAPWGSPRGAEPPSAAGDAAPGPDLRGHLAAQAGADLRDPAERAIAALLLGLVDETGYIVFDAAALAAEAGCAPADVERVLARLQQLEPPGVFARSLAECLALQLADRGRLDAPMRGLLDRLDRIADGGEEEVAAALGVDAARLGAMLAEVRSLDPRPGLAVGGPLAPAVVPDVIVDEEGEGWRVELNPAAFPRVYADRAGYRAARARARTGPEAEYLAERWDEAASLVRALRQRARTVFRVADLLVRLQDGFLRRGPAALRPLTLREAAEVLGLHESTVSRVAANKAMATPRGTLPFRAFFAGRIGAAEGRAGHAAGAVRERIRALVAAEEGAGPALSDREIALALAREGVDVARRTVAKYRGLMGIPPASRRRARAGVS